MKKKFMIINYVNASLKKKAEYKNVKQGDKRMSNSNLLNVSYKHTVILRKISDVSETMPNFTNTGMFLYYKISFSKSSLATVFCSEVSRFLTVTLPAEISSSPKIKAYFATLEAFSNCFTNFLFVKSNSAVTS